AVLATTLSLMAVFLPVAFMAGIVGRFLKSFGLTMSFAIGVSLLVSFTLTPMLSARWLKAKTAAHHTARKRVVDRVYRPIESIYMVVLRFVMRQRWIVIIASVAALVSLGPLMKRVPKSFLPLDDESQFELQIRAPEGTSVRSTDLIAGRLARRIRE